MSADFVIELRRGSGQPPFLSFGQGSELPPTSVGLHGDWRVEADGILDVHAFLYFDGARLFLQSADMRNAVRVNGKPIGADWSPVEAPCTIAMGDARLVFCPASQASAISSPGGSQAARGAPTKAAAPRAVARPAPQARANTPLPTFDDGAATMMNMPATQLPSSVSSDDLDEATGSIPLPGGKPVARRPSPGPAQGMYEEDIPTTRAQMQDFDRGDMGMGDEGETTRALPLPAIARGPGGGVAPAPPRPMAALPQMPAMTVPTVIGPQGMNADASQGPIAAPPAAAPTGPVKVSPLDQAKAQWKEASLPKKAIALLLPVAFVMVIFGLDDPPAPKPKQPPKAASAEPSAEAAAKPTKQPAATAKEPEADPPVAQKDPAPQDPPHKDPEPKAKPEPASKTKDPKDKGSSPATVASMKTPERVAIDSIAAGAYDPAAKAYDDLAKSHPENPAYKEAARILKAKAAPKK